MYNEIDFFVKKASLEEMQREAQRYRLVREALEGQKENRVYHPEQFSLRRVYRQVLVWVGGWMARVGESLQSRYAEECL